MAKYPMKEVRSPFGGTYYREMTPNEYTAEIAWFENQMLKLSESRSRRDREYASYLRLWFSDQQCDGTPDFFFRFDHHKLPMSYNVYFG